MAYAERYFHEYCDIHDVTFRISLQEWGYTGPAKEVDCGPEQFVIERPNSGGIAIGAVYPSRATAVFVAEEGFDLINLYTGTDRQFLLVRYRDGVMDWQGNVLVDGISQSNWDANKMLLTFKASDNLATLKSSPFVDADGENYGNDGNNIRSFLWAIKEGLKKTGFNMNIWTFVDLKPLVQGAGGTVYTATMEPPLTSLADYFIFTFNSIEERAEVYNGIDTGDIITFQDGELEGLSFTVSSKGSISTRPPFTFRLHVVESRPAYTRYTPTFSIAPPPTTGQEDPLYKTDHDVRVWIKDSNVEGKTYYEARGGAMNTWEVLDAIARQWGVVIQQNGGHWEVRRWNADKLPAGEYEWFVYNSEGTPIGRQPFGEDIYFPCKSTEKTYRLFGTVLNMDRVLKNVIVNYRYKYRQEGDTLKNLVDNPNMEGVAPNYVPQWNHMRIPDIIQETDFTILPYTGSIPPPGINSAVSIENRTWLDFLANRRLIREANPIRQVNKGDRVIIEWWERIVGLAIGDGVDAGVYNFAIWPAGRGGTAGGNNVVYNAIARSTPRARVVNVGGSDTIYQTYTGGWDKKDGRDEGQVIFSSLMQDVGGYGTGTWRKITLELDESPIDGFLIMEIYGATRIYPKLGLNTTMAAEKNSFFETIGFVPAEAPSRRSVLGQVKATLSPRGAYTLTVTGFRVNKLIDADNEAVPQIDPFMYPDYQAQQSRDYTDTIKEIEVLTGDDYGQYTDDRISGMSWGNNVTLFWDTWDNRYGWSRQGLTTAKSLMELYWSPTRLLQCEINAPGLDWSSRVSFEELPGKRFVLLSGSMGGSQSSFRGLLKEIFDINELPLPPGGNDGNSTTTPDWQPTGVTRCARGSDGLNTGVVERVETDINQASATYGQERWTATGTDAAQCPIGAPIDMFWGAQLNLFVNTLRFEPYVKEDDAYTVGYSNDNSNVYLRFLHRADLGTVRSIVYDSGYESISGWEYEADVVLEGYTYKNLKLTWFVGVFSNLNVTFVIN